MANDKKGDSAPRYQQVKDYIVGKINSGILLPGMKIESETELVKQLGVSRMTVNRAIRELTAEGRLSRQQGRGTFVATSKTQSTLLEINAIDQEIRERGGSYSCKVHLLTEEKVNPSVAEAMGVAPYSPIYHSIIVHKDGGIPIQLGCRYINPSIFPVFLQQDFTEITVSAYLLKIAPVSAIEHVVEALIPEAWIRELLEINAAEPCLALHRKTWVGEDIATSSTFYYPGSRYTLGGKFSPESPGGISIT